MPDIKDRGTIGLTKEEREAHRWADEVTEAQFGKLKSTVDRVWIALGLVLLMTFVPLCGIEVMKGLADHGWVGTRDLLVWGTTLGGVVTAAIYYGITELERRDREKIWKRHYDNQLGSR